MLICKIFGAITGLLIGFCYSAAFIVIFQTYVSAYFIIRGTTLFYNLGFLNEISMIHLSSMQSENLIKLNYFYYGYQLVIFILWIIFMKSFIQRIQEQDSAATKYLDEENH